MFTIIILFLFFFSKDKKRQNSLKSFGVVIRSITLGRRRNELSRVIFKWKQLCEKSKFESAGAKMKELDSGYRILLSKFHDMAKEYEELHEKYNSQVIKPPQSPELRKVNG